MAPDVLKAMVDRQRPIPAERFAKRALRGVARNRAIIVIPSWWKVAWWLYRLSPNLGLYLGRKGWEAAKRAMGGVPPDQATPTVAAEPAPGGSAPRQDER